MLRVAESGRTFETEDGAPLFWLADTCWSAPWRASWDEWVEYVDYRAAQGFSVLQVAAIPYQDYRCDMARVPFQTKENGFWDFESLNPDYFNFLKRMVVYANQKHITVAMVLMWWGVIPNARLWTQPMPRPVMTLEQACRYVKLMSDRFHEDDIVWIVSGDDTYYGEGVLEFNKSVGSFLREQDGGVHMITEHPSVASGRFFHQESWLDFNMIQSSHFDAHQNLCYQLSQEEWNRKPAKPVVNAEICYEGHKGFDYGHHFLRKDVRQAFWWSVLEGSLAGITYGAEGIFNWIREEDIEAKVERNIWISWNRAMIHPGAEDVARSRKFLESISWQRLAPSNSRILNRPFRHLSCAAADGIAVVYFPPYIPPTEGILELDVSDFAIGTKARLWNPADGTYQDAGTVEGPKFCYLAPDNRDSILMIGD